MELEIVRVPRKVEQNLTHMKAITRLFNIRSVARVLRKVKKTLVIGRLRHAYITSELEIAKVLRKVE